MKLNVEKIVVILAERGLTKSECAAKCGISRQNLSTILGRGSCEPRTAGRIALGLGVKIEEITAGVE